MRTQTPLLAALAAACAVHALPTVHRDGRYLYTPDGNRFLIKGIAYQKQGASPSSFYCFCSLGDS